MPSDLVFFGSLSSPYCYFALDRIEDIARTFSVSIVMRPVLPGVIRIPGRWSNSAQIERDYFDHDMRRTAAFLNLPYDEPQPPLLNWPEDGTWAVEPDQSRVFRLYNMLHQAHIHAHGYALYAALMRLIWRGEVHGWDADTHLRTCLVASGLPEHLAEQPTRLTPDADRHFAANERALSDCGHWGVPTFCWDSEPFFGQDRIDQLRWRIESA